MLDNYRTAHEQREACTGHHLKLTGAILPIMQAAQHVLEIGPGRASFARQVLRGKRVTFVEPYQPAADAIEAEREAAWHVYRQDVRDGLPCGTYDVIYASHVIEHLDGNALRQFLADADAALEPGGYLILAAPLLWAHFYCDITHKSPWMPHTIVRNMCGGFGDMSSAPVSARYKPVIDIMGYEEDYTTDKREQVYVTWERPYLAARWWVLDYALSVGRRVLHWCGLRLVRRNSWLLVLRKQ